MCLKRVKKKKLSGHCKKIAKWLNYFQKIQNQPSHLRCSIKKLFFKKLRNIHRTNRKTPVLESLFIRSLTSHIKTGFFSINIRNQGKCLFYFMIRFPLSLYSRAIFLWWGEKEALKIKYLLELSKRRSKVEAENMSCEHVCIPLSGNFPLRGYISTKSKD